MTTARAATQCDKKPTFNMFLAPVLSKAVYGRCRTHCTRSCSTGQAVLSLVFLIGGIAVLVGVTLAFLVTSFLSTSFGFEASQRALAVATAGAEDGVLQLVRNKSFSDAVGYSVPLGNDTATVTITQNSPTGGQATVVSTAAISGNRRRLQVIVSIDPATGQVSVVSWQQTSI
jgi:hypothetical protein